MGRRPKEDFLNTFEPSIKQYILTTREDYPGWGAKTIHTELQHDERFSNLVLPSVRSIGLLLKAKGLVRRYEKHVPMPDSKIHPAVRPHQLWQMDAQGAFTLNNIGPIVMINIKDVFSRTYCMAFPNKKESIHGYSKRVDYQCVLRLAFIENGLPEQVQTDHESIFHENKGKSPFPTLFHLWLIGLGIQHVFSRIHQPTDQGLVERMHQTIEKQAIEGVNHRNWDALFELCQKRRYFLNNTFPCASLGDKPPYEAFPEARYSGRYYHPQKEEEMFDLSKVYEFLAKGKWYRIVSDLGSVTLGGNAYYLSKVKGKTQVIILFDADTLLLSFHDVKEQLIQTILPIKGIDKKTLMGEVFWKMSNVQLELPFDWETQKVSTTLLHKG